MKRHALFGLFAFLLCTALAACFLLTPHTKIAIKPAQPVVTPFGIEGQLSLVAGDGISGLRDGAALQARFADPYGMAQDAAGNLYVADAGDNNRIRKISADGTVNTLAGSKEGFADGQGSAAAFNTPSGLALDVAGNVYVADTGNHAIRKITPQGVVSTLAGNGTAGFNDGPAAQAQFNGPIGVAVDSAGLVYVADTYNDRIRVIQPNGQVSTLAGREQSGFADGTGPLARFDTPTALALDAQHNLWIADTRNNAIRKLTPNGTVSTLVHTAQDDHDAALRRPISLAVTHDGYLYVGEMSHGMVLQLSPTGELATLIGITQAERLARPSSLVLDANGGLYVSDAGSYRLHHISLLAAGQVPVAAVIGPADGNSLPANQGRWPLAPQDGWHEIVGTLGEVRGNDQGESRDHLHGGLDISGKVGDTVLAIADAKVSSPSAAWRFDDQSEGLGLDTVSYIHMRVGRTTQGKLLDPRFTLIQNDAGKPDHIRLQRGTRFKAGDPLGTLNGMAHVHLSVGANGFEHNAIALGFKGFVDTIAPHIDAIQLLDNQGQPLSQKQDGRITIPRGAAGVQIGVDAWDQVDHNLPRRRLGLYALGFQILRSDGSPLPGFEQPHMNIEFNRMPPDDEAALVAYAANSGETVHGSAATRFRYVVSNTVRGGKVAAGLWQTSQLPAGDYTLRVTARDYSGNVAKANRDVAIRLPVGS